VIVPGPPTVLVLTNTQTGLSPKCRLNIIVDEWEKKVRGGSVVGCSPGTAVERLDPYVRWKLLRTGVGSIPARHPARGCMRVLLIQ